MARYGMLINTKKCVGCFACRLACQAKNHLEPTEASSSSSTSSRRREFPTCTTRSCPPSAQHCEDAPCAAVCPTHATYITDSGVVLVDPEKCIGCKYCMAACPYGARIVQESTGVVEKCRFCLMENGEPGNPPACVGTHISARACFGDLTTLKATSRRLSRRFHARPLASNLTESKIYYGR